MRPQKYRIGLAATVVALVTVAACGGPSTPGGSGGSGGSGDTAKKGPYTIGLDVFFEGNSFQAENVALFKQECKKLGPKIIKECIVQNANNNTGQQIAQLQGMINRKVDAILLDATSTTGLNGTVQQAENAGIPVINYNTLISGNPTTKIGVDDSQWGGITGKWLVNELHAKGNLIVLNGLAGNPVSNQRYAGAKALFAKTPGIHVLQEANADWDQAKAQSKVSQMLNAYPKIDGVWSQGGAMTAGAIIEFQKAHRPLVPMTGEDYNGFLKQWIDNKPKGFSSISPGDPNWEVIVGLHAAVLHLQGKEIPKEIDIPLPVITDQTVSKYYRADKDPSYWVLDSVTDAEMNKLLGQS